jgi:hypothetical protein
MDSLLCPLFWVSDPLYKYRHLSKSHLLLTLEALNDPICGGCGHRGHVVGSGIAEVLRSER